MESSIESSFHMDGRRPMKRCRVLHGLGAVDAGNFAALYIPCGGEIQCTLWTGEEGNGAIILPPARGARGHKQLSAQNFEYWVQGLGIFGLGF